jgi:hypothetical protein
MRGRRKWVDVIGLGRRKGDIKESADCTAKEYRYVKDQIPIKREQEDICNGLQVSATSDNTGSSNTDRVGDKGNEPRVESAHVLGCSISQCSGHTTKANSGPFHAHDEDGGGGNDGPTDP